MYICHIICVRVLGNISHLHPSLIFEGKSGTHPLESALLCFITSLSGRRKYNGSLSGHISSPSLPALSACLVRRQPTLSACLVSLPCQLPCLCLPCQPALSACLVSLPCQPALSACLVSLPCQPALSAYLVSLPCQSATREY